MGYAFHVRWGKYNHEFGNQGTKAPRGVGLFVVRWVVGRQDGEAESACAARHDVDIRG